MSRLTVQRLDFERAYQVIMGPDVDHGFSSFSSGCYAYPALQRAWSAWQRAIPAGPSERSARPWETCGVHGRAAANDWGCPQCVRELREELAVTAKLLADREQLLKAVPERAAHGPCVPHAIEWVESAAKTLAQLGYTWAGGELWQPPIGPRPARFGGPAPEIDYEALIQYGWKHFRYRQGTKECVAFAKGAEWMRDQDAVEAHIAEVMAGPPPDHPVWEDNGAPAVADPSAPCDVAGPQHYCGLSGYNPMLGDTCPGCEADRHRPRAAKKPT